MSSEMKISAATVRRHREARAWSQEQLATVSGISARTVQRVESEGVASLETRMALAAALGCEPAMLLESAVVQREVLAQPATSSSANPPGALSPTAWISLAWLLFAVIAFMAVFGVENGKDMAARDNQRAEDAKAERAHLPPPVKANVAGRNDSSLR